MNFMQELRQQRWDDHRYYHQNRVNQALHLVSALCFLSSYVLIFYSPILAVMVGWLLAMVLRQIGHFYFEPKTYDHVNTATHEYKESVKVGYNLKRKIILLSIWVLVPFVLVVDSSFFGLVVAHQNTYQLINNISILWFIVGMGAVLFRTIQLFVIMNIQSGIVWALKILTDPFHDIYIYFKAPFFIFRGEMYDNMTDWYIPEFVEEIKSA